MAFTRAVGIRSWNRTFWGISLIPPCAAESYIWMQAPQHEGAAERDVEAAAMAVKGCASPQHPACPETGGVGMPTDPEIARLSKTEFLLEHTTQHQQQSFLCLQFGSRNTGSARYV